MTDSAEVQSLIDAETARLVRQEHPHGCGIAALAMVTDRTYAEVFTELLGYAGKGDWSTEERVAQSGLHKGIVDWYLAKHGYVWRTLTEAEMAALFDAVPNPDDRSFGG